MERNRSTTARDTAASFEREVGRRVVAAVHASKRPKTHIERDAGIDHMSFARRMRGESRWRVEELPRVADALGVPLASFVGMPTRSERRAS